MLIMKSNDTAPMVVGSIKASVSVCFIRSNSDDIKYLYYADYNIYCKYYISDSTAEQVRVVNSIVVVIVVVFQVKILRLRAT